MDFLGLIICGIVMIMAMFFWAMVIYLALLAGCVSIDIIIDEINKLKRR
ncbi:MAG: hypothetical protein ACRC7N_00880 [Clostridium sp.]